MTTLTRERFKGGESMRTIVSFVLAAAISTLAASVASGADPAGDAPSTSEVLAKLHRSNLKEIQMGQMAKDHGTLKEVKAYGETLVKDHTEADGKVSKLAKEKNIDLTVNSLPVEQTNMPMGAGFDAAFARDMVEDHKKDIAEVEAAKSKTRDAQLKKLLEGLLPVLKKHESIAQKLVAQTSKS
jgi:putative membrane protein